MKAYFDNKQAEIINTMVYPAPYIRHRIASFVNLTVNGGGVLRIECDSAPKKIDIRPRRYNIDYRADGNSIEIPINAPCNFSVELDSDCNNGLMVFASKLRKIEKGAYDNIITVERGRHFAGEIEVTEDNTLIYFEDGAYADGKITAKNCDNLTIAGNGIISMENYCRNGGSYGAVRIDGCTNVQIKDITVLDSCNWSVCISGCDNVIVDNCKVIGQRGNSDGIDVCGSRNVHVKNCFTRVWDDSLVVKAFNTGDVSDILFENCVLWNDFARPIEVGVELRADRVHDVCFRNIDIIHSPTGYPLMGIHHGDRADVYNISFENINVENSPAAQIFDIRITDSVWNSDAKKGGIHDILFANINITENCGKALSPSRLHGYSSDADVENVVIENVRICGMAARNAQELNLITNGYVKNVNFKVGEPPYISPVKTDISYKDGFSLKNGYYDGIVSVTAENLSDETVSGKCRFEVKPSHRAKIFGDDLTFLLKPREKAARDYRVIIPPGKFVIEVQNGEVLFSVEETDWANAPAVINGDNGAELAPQLRCPAEITYVFKNEPKVEKIEKINIQPTLTGEGYITIGKFDVKDVHDEFWFELEVEADGEKRYPVCLFGSQQPDSICHMFAQVMGNTGKINA